MNTNFIKQGNKLKTKTDFKITVDKSKDGEKRNCETCQYWKYENNKALIETCNFGNIEHSYRADSFMCNNYKPTN